jgi:hypothetical protein
VHPGDGAVGTGLLLAGYPFQNHRARVGGVDHLQPGTTRQNAVSIILLTAL